LAAETTTCTRTVRIFSTGRSWVLGRSPRRASLSGADGQRPPGAIVAQQVVDRIAGTDVLIELGGLADKRAESSSKHRCAKIL